MHALIWLAVWSLYEAFTSGDYGQPTYIIRLIHVFHKEKAAAWQTEQQQKYTSGPHS